MRKRSNRPLTFAPTDREQLAQRADQVTLPNFDEKYFVRASTLGIMPGQDVVDAVYRVRGELGVPHLPVLPELPDRGYQATTLARTIACLEGLTADGTASGWRIRTGRADESERASALLTSDINALADVIGQEKTKNATPYQLRLTGPISLSASVYRSNGELLLSDHGARRDIVQSLCEGLKPWIKALNEATRHAPLTLHLAEPYLEDAMKGAIPTSSGYKTHRNIPLHEVEAIYSALKQELGADIEQLVVAMPAGLRSEVYVEPDAVAFSLEQSDIELWENIARLIERGKHLFLGIQNPTHYFPVAERAEWFIKNWRLVGLPLSALSQVTVTETTPMSGISPEIATTVMHHIAEVARAIAESASDVE